MNFNSKDTYLEYNFKPTKTKESSNKVDYIFQVWPLERRHTYRTCIASEVALKVTSPGLTKVILYQIL